MTLPIPQELQGTTQALFYEHRHQTTCKTPPVYNMKDKDWNGTKSMYLIYMQYETEYDAAIGLLGSWKHWEKLKGTTWFNKIWVTWEEERSIRDNALARRALLEQAKEGNVTAAKAVLSGGANPGRPANKKSPKKTSTRAETELLKNFKVLQGGKENE